ncbi:hypothetical protein BJV82DRAFT_584063 [Fennellomyces sp. T-0311]|nr:hypothetical protein BJV82DRAFT_584063 [Fennellomyces sp. T-0311]
MPSDTFEYPGISHAGPIKSWQKTVYPESGSIIFAFSGTITEYYQARNALIYHYGEDAFDAMRKLEQTDDTHSMIVEAHFARATDRSRELSKALKKNEQISIWCHIKNSYQSGKRIKFKMFPSVPILGPFTVYRFDNLPLGASTEICAIVKKRIISMLMEKLVKYEKKDVMPHLIDIVPGYDDDGEAHLFDGTISVVFKDFIGVYLQFDSIVFFVMLVTDGIKYFGPVESWRKSSTWVPSVMLTFDSAQVTFFDIRKALYEKFGRDKLAGVLMRQEDGQILMVEVFILDGKTRRQIISESMFSASTKLNVAGNDVNFKAWPALPFRPTFRLYKIESLPLRSEADVCLDLWTGITDRLRELSISRGWFEEVPEDHLIDIVPEHSVSATESVFDGTVYIVLQDGDFGTRNYFTVYRTRISAAVFNGNKVLFIAYKITQNIGNEKPAFPQVCGEKLYRRSSNKAECRNNKKELEKPSQEARWLNDKNGFRLGHRLKASFSFLFQFHHCDVYGS